MLQSEKKKAKAEGQAKADGQTTAEGQASLTDVFGDLSDVSDVVEKTPAQELEEAILDAVGLQPKTEMAEVARDGTDGRQEAFRRQLFQRFASFSTALACKSVCCSRASFVPSLRCFAFGSACCVAALSTSCLALGAVVLPGGAKEGMVVAKPRRIRHHCC